MHCVFLLSLEDAQRCVSTPMLNVLLLGMSGKGKSTTGNKLLNVEEVNVTDQVKKGALKQEWPVNCSGSDQGNGCNSVMFETKPTVSSVNKGCKVITNTDTGFRIMDTMGFVPYDVTANLQIVRELVRVCIQLEVAFHRVLYFLPERDIPERADGHLQEELTALWHYYGYDIFKNMVIVITAAPRSKSTNSDIDTEFGEGATFAVQQIFLEALKNAIHGREDATLPPCPDIAFIPFLASSESVAEIVRNAKVHAPDGIRLDFRKTTCSKCTSVIHIKPRTDTASIAATDDEEGRISIPEDTKCHPALIPKYTKLVRFIGGVGHIATLGIPQGVYRLAGQQNTVWPWFFNSEEKCVACEHPSGAKGCTRIGDIYNGIVVKHNHAMLTVQVVNQ